ncbi:PAS domain S-box [Geoglobus ahangari]|uniref:histidine kinase n=1 Tax=Geoglobus ahangari TaxID=113653 RepID=A0A0F7IEY5_9EURY|nr:PAS domain S-box protein [Geoglobus ahangari]AKG90980.1 PAS domain S-box [Geoglobus ahangari]
MINCSKFNEDFWRLVADKSLAGIYVHDDQYRILYVNEIVEKATGYSREELVGSSILDLVYHEDLEKIKKVLDKIFDEEIVSYECRYLTKSGKVRWVWGYVTPVRCEDGLYVIGNWIDITKRKQLEEQLKENSELFRVLVHESPNPAYIVQGEKFVYANKSLLDLLGYTWDELKRMNPLNFVHPEDRETVERRYRERLSGKRAAETYSWRVITKDGSVFWVTGRPSRIMYKGKPAVTSILVDTTDLHMLTSELKKKSEYLSLVNKILRHDILNDITVVEAALEMNDEKLRENAMRKIDRIVTLIKESKAIEEAVGATYSVNLADYVREVARSYECVADIQYSLMDVFVKANESVKSVIDNILRNAVTHSGRERVTILLETCVEGRFGVLRIRDDGKGVPDEIKDRVFEEGFSTIGSTGLGLFIAKKVVELLGGEIKVYDNVPSGAVFELKLRRY